MEVFFMLFMAIFGAIVLPLALILTGAIGSFVCAKVIQKEEPGVSRSDVSAIIKAWIISFTKGGAIAAIFFAYALVVTFSWSYLQTGISMTIGFALVGFYAGSVGAKSMFQRLEALSSRLESSSPD
jgi:hypothetical protein